MNEPAEPAEPAITDVLRAGERIREVVRRTPIERSATLSETAGTEVFLKLENRQYTRSFKLRGATNALLAHREVARQRGVVTASAGNHGTGIAFAARALGIRATVFVPDDAPRVKRQRIEEFGAALQSVAGSYDDAHDAAERFAAREDALYVHAFSDPEVVAGQGTVGLEICEDFPDVGTLLVPVGGGGLIGGIGIVARALAPRARIVGVQSRETAAMHASLQANRLISPPMGATLCDGLSGDVDARSLALARRVVDRMILVDERAVRGAIRHLYTAEGLVVEGSGAVVAAALRGGDLNDEPGSVVAILSGGNIEPSVLDTILSG